LVAEQLGTRRRKIAPLPWADAWAPDRFPHSQKIFLAMLAGIV
jgi:hypothetical protein